MNQKKLSPTRVSQSVDHVTSLRKHHAIHNSVFPEGTVCEGRRDGMQSLEGKRKYTVRNGSVQSGREGEGRIQLVEGNNSIVWMGTVKSGR